MSETTFLLVAGFFSSGSSAVVDLLKEFSGTYECTAEIRTIKDPYGICQMEDALTEHWELINSSAAINDFLSLCKICCRKGGCFPLARAGLSYKKTIHPDFMKITQEYIDRLTDFRYNSDFYYAKFKKSYLRYVTDRCRQGVEKYSKGKIRITNRKHLMPSYFAHPTHEEFNAATQEYFEKLYADHIGTGKNNYIILDQAVSPNNTQIIHRYFKKAKMIIIDRDPRDMYIDDIVHWGENLDSDTDTAEAGRRYVLRQRALRESIPADDKDVLYIRFEDLILKYDETVLQIFRFLGLDSTAHIRKLDFLQPERSAKNIGIWKHYYKEYKAALDIIEGALPELCYQLSPDGENI